MTNEYWVVLKANSEDDVDKPIVGPFRDRGEADKALTIAFSRALPGERYQIKTFRVNE